MKKIYTRTGDKGMTALFTGERVNKHHPFIDALGAVDECNCAIGAALSFFPREARFHGVKAQLEAVQHTLFDVGAALATPRTHASEAKVEKTRFNKESIEVLEHWIDSMEEELPPLHTFILPGGHSAGATLHLARSLVRRAERIIVPLYEQGDVSLAILTYLNRLSDYLFVLSRYSNHLLHAPETLWEKQKEMPPS